MVAALAITACFDAPWWRSDRYVVDGELDGRTCRARLSGGTLTDTVPLARGDSVWPGLGGFDNVPYQGRTVGVNDLSVFCGPVVFEFQDQAPPETPGAPRVVWVPAPGRYPVAGGVIPFDRDTVRATLVRAPVDEGRWPLALGGAYLDARYGWLRIDSMAWDTQRRQFRAVGQFHFVARRRAAS